MDVSKFHLQQALTPLSSLIGVLGLGGGVYGLTNPMAFSETLGIRVTSPTSPALPFVAFVAARNLGSGLTVLALTATGQRKAVGTIFILGVSVAMADAWICAKFGAIEGKATAHALMGVVIGVLGCALYWS